MKKGILSACIAFVLIACSFIPFNGKSFAKSMENWIKQINLKYTLSMPDGTKAEISHTAVVDQDQESPLQSIYDERDKALAEAENITDPAEKQKKIDEILKETEAKIEEKRAADNAMLLQENTIIDYASIEEAKANIAIDFPVPNYIPEGYILDKVTYSKHNSGIQEMVRFTYKPSDISPTELASKDYLIINYILQNLGTADTAENQINITESFSKDTDMEEYAVLNNPGYILKKIDIKENKIFMSINTICEGFRASAGMTIHSSNMEGDMEKVKSELTKVMESFISQQ